MYEVYFIFLDFIYKLNYVYNLFLHIVDKNMLKLQLATNPQWATLANQNIGDILIDHAYCEQKAASSCISLIVNFPDKAQLVETLTPIVAEEWSHFAMVLEMLKKRNIPLARKRKDEYVILLEKIMTPGGDRENHLMECLLIHALVEARSCERFKILAEQINDDELKEFYKNLLVAEVRHYQMFIDLAKFYSNSDIVDAKFNEFVTKEAKIIELLSTRGDRIHG